MKTALVFAWLALLLTVAPVALAADEQADAPDEIDQELSDADDEVNYLSLAAVLIGDGNYQRARLVLSRVDLEDEELDRARYHTLSGLVALYLDEMALAGSEFEKAIEAGSEQPVLWLYLAQVRFAQEDYSGTLQALDQAGSETTAMASVYLMRAQSHWQLGELDLAWDVLVEGRSKFDERSSEFARQQVFLLVEQGLYQEAAEQGRRFLQQSKATAKDAVAIGNALRQAEQYDEALSILEPARMSYPAETSIAKVLAHTYLAREQVLAAAQVLADAARHDPALVSEAAELYRRAGWLIQALTLNSSVIDQKVKLRQRLAILIALKRFDMAAGMRQDLERVGLLSDEDIRYALAYSLFKRGDFDDAQVMLAQLSRADLFRKAAELRTAMQECAQSPWLCG